MNRFNARTIAFALACVAMPGAVGAASQAAAPMGMRFCVNVVSATGTGFGLASLRASGGGTVLESVTGTAAGAEKSQSSAPSMRRLEPLALSAISGMADIQALGYLLTSTLNGVAKNTFRQGFIDIATLDRENRPLNALRFVRPWLTSVTVPELVAGMPAPAMFGADFIPELIEYSPAVPNCLSAMGAGSAKAAANAIADSGRWMFEGDGLNSSAVLRIGAFKVGITPVEVPTAASVRLYAPGQAYVSPITLTLDPTLAQTWFNWFQQGVQGKVNTIRKNFTIRLLDMTGTPRAAIILIDTVPVRLAPQFGDKPIETMILELRPGRVEMQ